MTRYPEHDEDEGWFKVKSRGFRQMCCDCGLVHIFDFRKGTDGCYEIRITRSERATAAARRKLKKRVVIVHE